MVSSKQMSRNGPISLEKAGLEYLVQLGYFAWEADAHLCEQMDTQAPFPQSRL